MVFALVGILAGIILVGYCLFKKFGPKDPGHCGIVCERTEDQGFYEDLDPDCLSSYQTALDRIFYLLDAPRFVGAVISRSQREAVEMLLVEAAAIPQVNPKYLRVMLFQFLQADFKTRREEDVFAHWAQRVYELDRKGTRHGPRGIPPAWKVYFNSSLHAEADLGRAER